MQLVVYIWRNVLRNIVRSTLTVFSVGFSLALMTLLYGYIAMQGVWAFEAEKYHRIVVMNSQGFSGLLPIAYVDRIRKVAGVRNAVPYSWYGGHYKEEQWPFAQFGTDPQNAFEVWQEYSIDPEQLKNWQGTRNGCVVDRRLADKRNWKIGERIPLQGTYYPFNLDLVLCGVFDSPKNTDSLWFHWEYLDEGLRQMNAPGSGNAGTIFAKTERAELIPEVAKAIDERFASSENPTRTQSEAAFAQMFSDMLGNVQALIQTISIAVVFALLLVATTTMAMSTRERTREIAVLKAIGFSRQRVLFTILGEACFITLLGGVLGITLGCLCLQVLHVSMSNFFQIPIHEMAGLWLLYLLAAAAVLGLISGIFPAIQAARISVIDGLRRVV